MQGQEKIRDPERKTSTQRSVKPESPHSIERRVHHELLNSDSLKFSSVIIHRIQGGVCLEGYLTDDSDSDNACHIAKQVRGVNKVLNHLVINKNKLPLGH